MIWLPIVSLAVGALLAQRFKIIVLVPATLLVVIVVIGAGVAQGNTVWLIILKIVLATVSTQAGYLVGMLLQHRLGALLAGRSSSLSHTTSARDPAC
jgi:hypothetical protein